MAFIYLFFQMYSSTPSFNIDNVNHRTLALENGLRSANAPKHAIDRIYSDQPEPVNLLNHLIPANKPFFRQFRRLL